MPESLGTVVAASRVPALTKMLFAHIFHPDMPRLLALLLPFIAASTTFAAASTTSILQAPERSVSAPAFVAAAGFQGSPLLSTNGDTSLAVWSEFRDGSVRATRIDAEGRPVDPLGIVVREHATAEAVVWNGTEFAVFLVEPEGVHVVALVTTSGTVTCRTLVVGNEYRFVAVAPRAARVLYVATTSNPVAMILDGRGDPAARALQLQTPAGRNDLQPVIGGAGEGEFLIFRSLNHTGFGTEEPLIVAERIAFDGRLLSTSTATLPIRPTDPHAIAGGPEGFVLVAANLDVTAYRLDRNGVFTGSAQTLLAAPSNLRYHGTPAVVRDVDHYSVAWHTSLQNGHSYTYFATLPASGEAVVTRAAEWLGITSGVALAAGPNRVEIATAVTRLGTTSQSDVFAQRVTTSTPQLPEVLAVSAMTQMQVATAVSAHGSLVAWNEFGGDGFTRLLVRRLAPDGSPQDAQPIEAARFATDAFSQYTTRKALATASADTYVIAWSDPGIRARRLDARTGRWLDDEPFSVDPMLNGEFALASNTRDALVTWSGACGDVPGRCISARPIALAGPPLTAPAVRVADAGDHYEVALASDGTDYLVAWSEGFRLWYYTCLCESGPFRMLAARLRADGTRIDIAPIVIEDTKEHPEWPSVAWDGERYAIVWTMYDAVRGARVTREGAVLERNADGRGVTVSKQRATRVLLVHHRGELILFVHELIGPLQRWTASSIEASAELEQFASAPALALTPPDSRSLITLDASSGPAGLLLAYDRVDDDLGRVARVYVRAIPDSRRTRAARR